MKFWTGSDIDDEKLTVLVPSRTSIPPPELRVQVSEDAAAWWHHTVRAEVDGAEVDAAEVDGVRHLHGNVGMIYRSCPGFPWCSAKSWQENNWVMIHIWKVSVCVVSADV